MSDKARFRELDALRGIAATWVLLFHYLTQYDVLYGGKSQPLIGSFSFPDGIYGVYLFFIISGFVIFMTLRQCETALDFVVSRFSRLFPAYWAGIAVTALVALVFPLPGQTISLQQVAANATMLQQFLYIKNIDGVYWTLCFELSFYVVMLGLFVSGLLRRMEAVCWGWLGFAMVNHLVAPFGLGIPFRINVLLVIPYAQLFIAGIVFHLVWVGGYTRNRGCLLAACLGVQCIVGGIATALIAGVFFAVFHFCVTGRMKWLAVGPALWLGVISYPLYLTHQMIGFRVIQTLLAHGASPSIVVPSVIAVALTLASAISFAIERPSMRVIRDWYRWFKAARMAAAVKSAAAIRLQPGFTDLD